MDLTILIKSIEEDRCKLANSLCRAIPQLLSQVSTLQLKKRLSCQLTNFYEIKHPLEIGYILSKGRIYKVAFDPKSDASEPGESVMSEVSEKEFLKWIRRNDLYALDAYKHLTEYILWNSFFQKDAMQLNLLSLFVVTDK